MNCEISQLDLMGFHIVPNFGFKCKISSVSKEFKTLQGLHHIFIIALNQAAAAKQRQCVKQLVS